jgi:hypothetical protein
MVRLLALLALLLPTSLLVACTGSSSGDDDDDDSAVAGDDDDATDPLPEPAALAALSDGECPAMETGTQTFSSGGEARSVIVEVPSSGIEGKPVVFFWHSLGTDAQYWYTQFGLQGFADEHDVVLLVPQALDSNLFEWDWVNGTDGSFFDDLRTCAVNAGADVRRVYTSGFSAGALWSTWLTMHRADALAASYLISGGNVLNLPWEAPAVPIPTVAISGGDTDVWTVISFQDATVEFVANMRAEGQFLIQCGHDLGHTPPPGSQQFLTDFLLDHTYGAPSPFESGDGVPDWCWLAE